MLALNVDLYLRRRPKSFLMALGFILLGLIGEMDYWTGREISLSIFYLVPIFLVTWYVDRRSGALISVAGALVWYIVDWMGAIKYSQSSYPYWNATVMFGFFLTVSFILSALRGALEHEKALARTDSLTGVINRRYFFELAQRENSRAHRHKQPFTVMFIDLDNFKDVNDVSGHMTGDALLRLVGETMRKNLRQTDIIARLGGDEFAVLLPETGPEPSVHIVMRKLQENLLQVMEKNGWPVTFSIGAVTFLRPPSSVDEMIRLPDDLMYSVKGKGKNMIKYAVFDG